MAETFCGKTCVECTDKASINCPGCRVGPGNAVNGDCDIARCCRGKGHEQCGTCNIRGHCGILRGRHGMAQYRRRKQEAVKADQERLSRNVALLGKWLYILFELVIAGVILNLISEIFNSGDVTAIRITFAVVSFMLTLAKCLIMLRLASASDRYRVAGLFGFTAAVIVLVQEVFPAWSVVLVWVAVVPSLIGEYNEYMAHAEQVDEIDSELAEKWRKLWYWYIGSLGVMLFSTLLLLIVPFLAALIMLASVIVTLVVAIMKIVYLYKTANLFRNYVRTSVQ